MVLVRLSELTARYPRGLGENPLYYWLPNMVFSVGSAKRGACLCRHRPEGCVGGWLCAEAAHAEAALPLNVNQ